MSFGNIEHDPYEGPLYKSGIGGFRIGVVGYSHYLGDTKDSRDFTSIWINNVAQHGNRIRFFTSVRNSFGFDNSSEFWERVVFFNYVPVMIGKSAEKFHRAVPELEARANERFVEIIDRCQLNLVFVFSKKTALGALGVYFSPLPAPYERFVAANLHRKGRNVRIIRLRHTQGAKLSELKGAIAGVLGNRI
jgi:hypothetical protein